MSKTMPMETVFCIRLTAWWCSFAFKNMDEKMTPQRIYDDHGKMGNQELFPALIYDANHRGVIFVKSTVQIIGERKMMITANPIVNHINRFSSLRNKTADCRINIVRAMQWSASTCSHMAISDDVASVRIFLREKNGRCNAYPITIKPKNLPNRRATCFVSAICSSHFFIVEMPNATPDANRNIGAIKPWKKSWAKNKMFERRLKSSSASNV